MNKIIILFAMFLAFNQIFASTIANPENKTNPKRHHINSQIHEEGLYYSKGNNLFIFYSYKNNDENFQTLKLVLFDTDKKQKITENDFITDFEFIDKIDYLEINKTSFYVILHSRFFVKLIKCTYQGTFVKEDQIDIPINDESSIIKYSIYDNNLYYSKRFKQDRNVFIKEMKYSFSSKNHTQIFLKEYFSPNYYLIDSYQIQNNFYYIYGMGCRLIIEKYDLNGNLQIKKQFANNLLHGNLLISSLIDDQFFIGYKSKYDDPLLRAMIVSKDMSVSASDSLLIQNSLDLKKIAIFPDNLKFCFAVISVEDEKTNNLLKITFNLNSKKISDPVLITKSYKSYDLTIKNFNQGIIYKLHSFDIFNYFCNEPLDQNNLPYVFNKVNQKFKNQLIIHQKDDTYLCIFFDNNNLYYNILKNDIFTFPKHKVLSKVKYPSPLINIKNLPPIRM